MEKCEPAVGDQRPRRSRMRLVIVASSRALRRASIFLPLRITYHAQLIETAARRRTLGTHLKLLRVPIVAAVLGVPLVFPRVPTHSVTAQPGRSPAMKLLNILAFAIFAAIAGFAAATATAAEFKLVSPTIKPNGRLPIEQVFNDFGCSGKNQSPELSWTAGPKATKSYALTVYDPDAPTGSGWWHWVVFNIPANVTKLPAGAGTINSALMPAGAVQGRTDYGVAGFGGACPPEGDKAHRYIFTVHALKTASIDVPPEASAALVGFMIHGSLLAKASLTAKYGR